MRWDSPQAALLRAVREQVFIEEQQVSPELEWEDDILEQEAVHLLALDILGNPIGTVRLLPNGQLGRMAVLANWRKQGLGSALLTKILAIAQARFHPKVFLHAQVHALPFYEKFGFSTVGEVFDEAGIPHQEMFLNHFV